MIYGYLRVSSDEQDVNAQKIGVDKFAAEHGWEIDEYITDEGVSGGKDPDKRNLGPMLKRLQKDDIVISSEISRLGRDLYMVMDILHFCMEKQCVIYTVKDRFVLGDDIQSKVLAFAFGLAAEIERQMIRQRTREGLVQRVRAGVLLGRPPGSKSLTSAMIDRMEREKDNIINALRYGSSQRNLARCLGIDRNTLYRYLVKWGLKVEADKYTEEQLKREEKERKSIIYKDGPLCVVSLPRDQVKELILQDLTIPQISERLTQFTYEQIYDSIISDYEFNRLYREHGQIKAKKRFK